MRDDGKTTESWRVELFKNNPIAHHMLDAVGHHNQGLYKGGKYRCLYCAEQRTIGAFQYPHQRKGVQSSLCSGSLYC
jgi:hypothetical protein